MTALMFEQPEDPVAFMENCLTQVRNANMISYEWSTFNSLVLKSTNFGTKELEASASLLSNKSIQAVTSENDKVVNCQAEIGDKLVLFILGELIV